MRVCIRGAGGKHPRRLTVTGGEARAGNSATATLSCGSSIRTGS